MHLTVFSNTSHGFREQAEFSRSCQVFQERTGLSITYQVFGEHIHILGTSLASSIKMIRKYRTRVIIYSKLSVINCVHMTAFSNTCQDFREHMPGLSGTYQVFRSHSRYLGNILMLGTALTSSIKKSSANTELA